VQHPAAAVMAHRLELVEAVRLQARCCRRSRAGPSARRRTAPPASQRHCTRRRASRGGRTAAAALCRRPAASYSAGRLDVVDRGARRGHEALPGAGEQGRVGKGAGPACIAGLDGAVPARVGRIAVALRARPAPRGRRLSTARDKMSFATGFDGSKCFGRRANDPGAMGVRMTIPGRRPRGAALAGLGLFRPDRTGARALLPERAAGIAVLSRT